jgi:hypothetical protein
VLVKGDIMRNRKNRHLNYQVNVMLEYAFEMKSHYLERNLKKWKKFDYFKLTRFLAFSGQEIFNAL